ncbi:CO(2)-response secreted protease [Capsicum chinense]|nr:CO(2)-response secreted protease [Capsicum chinense]
MISIPDSSPEDTIEMILIPDKARGYYDDIDTRFLFQVKLLKKKAMEFTLFTWVSRVHLMITLLLCSLTARRENAVVHSYKNSFSGFAARLSDDEAQSIAQHPGVVSVFPIHSGSNSTSSNGADTIIGIFDTGIWPELESFNDKGIGPVPSRWKGTCTRGYDFKTSSCNRKLVGARFYDEPGVENPPHVGTPRDHDGHGTHVAAIVAGSPVADASYYGLAGGTAKGGSPGSRIAVYRVCTPNTGCSGSAIMKAFDDAIADGVDIINLSFGQPAGTEFEFSRNPIDFGAFHAVEKGIFVVASAGNDGPAPESVVKLLLGFSQLVQQLLTETLRHIFPWVETS